MWRRLLALLVGFRSLKQKSAYVLRSSMQVPSHSGVVINLPPIVILEEEWKHTRFFPLLSPDKVWEAGVLPLR
jgi:hypothetical protein